MGVYLVPSILSVAALGPPASLSLVPPRSTFSRTCRSDTSGQRPSAALCLHTLATHWGPSRFVLCTVLQPHPLKARTAIGGQFIDNVWRMAWQLLSWTQ